MHTQPRCLGRVAAWLVVTLALTGARALADEDKPETPLQTAVREGVKALKDSEKTVTMIDEFLVVNEAQLTLLKQQLEKVQKNNVADTLFDLSKATEALEMLQDQFERQDLYWKANFDYTLARLYARQARVLEYNVMLGKIRRDDMPAIDKEKHKGWHLASKETLSDRDGKELADRARTLLKKVAKEHPGTPWELIATKDLNERFGLEWVPLAK